MIFLKKNIKSDSYFRINSGLFGTKWDADEIFTRDVEVRAEALKKNWRKKRRKKMKKRFRSFKKGKSQ